ncbi:3-oxoacyl-ACP reductase family protein [Mesorhizobium sp.]|uniref:SDR family NAD(P)-dependent oxidoreductase n=1 Tax=Mesorhizobium sp. TaxID=1871066 RepID=UPI000FE4A1CC|nr:3-oxoacyl-ACP reductase family protein [Mesorhizobium sp.]RWH01131.1 MAG: 3-oxoacyl-ACP reductase FabG [Mesorhizobium sp.]RWI16652.1 MAG: 3-oxoacyl-ACP reductase FabG [Mesorhizobium sp.]RWN07721.1 MAG: 3-oxoacyl-ACP reductase FabG [Mesorhizobium sp.]RWN12362.1 MAG: 3-oxoacyl-ACP reductase FabG [Mesorhizobium sp.]TIQ97767.1 MAG: 3-oxoacyl-ACP reductase FabG [Mesorhizobium sp.]
MRLSGRTAVVTGAGRGIGLAVAEAYVREGANVVIVDRDSDVASEAADRLGQKTLAVRADISVDDDVASIVEKTIERFGTVEILVNNAGVGATTLFLESSREEFERVVRINLTGTFLVAQAFARIMAAKRYGRIINIASLSGQKGGVGRSAYGASKAGVELLTKVMAVELAESGITVNSIAPGPILTEVSKVMHTVETREAYHRLVPQRRYGEPSEIADAAVFLASDEAAYITGHTLNVDGGFLAAGLMFPFDPKASKRLGQISE